MQELWLKFVDGDGRERSLKIEGTEFTVGRHSSNDLCIPDSRLSREHIKIERIGLDFFVSDSGSTNGTTLNDESISGSVKLKAGDRLNLGKGIEIEVAASEFEPEPGGDDVSHEESSAFVAEQSSAEQVGDPPLSESIGSPGGGGGIPTSIFIIAPVLGLLILVFLGVIIFFVASGDSSKPAGNFVYTNDDPYNGGPSKRIVDDPPSNNSKPDKTPADVAPSNNGPAGNADPTSTPIAKDPATDSAKFEQNGAAFLRLIAQKEPKAFLTGEQAIIVSARVKQIGTSSAIADNINSARRSTDKIKALAAAKSLKPQLLATAALAKLGTSRGDPLQVAAQMADTLHKLDTQIGSELANDSLLLIAAYDQGAGGDFMKMRNMLQDLATKSPDSARTIRTIWFLHKNSKITDAEYDFALNFLAIGTITQNPKAFGVNAEALSL